MSHVVGFLPPSVPQVLINLTPVAPLPHLSNGFDACLLGLCDEAVAYLESKLEWTVHDEDTASGELIVDSAKSVTGVGNGNDKKNGSNVPCPQSSNEDTLATDAAAAPSSTTLALPRPAGERMWRLGTSQVDDSSSQLANSVEHSSSSSGSIEVVNCDECGDTLTAGYNCLSCFDYDLCAKCHKSGQSKHARKTGHRFKAF